MFSTATMLSSLVPLLVGFIWYNKNTLGTAWMHASGIQVEDAKKANMVKMVGFTLLFGVLLAFTLQFMVVHQRHIFSLLGGDPKYSTEANLQLIKNITDATVDNFRTFKHGAFHGFMSGLLLGLAFVGIPALFEMRSWKYIFIHVGYFTITLMLMGGIISAWG
jgi:hypothetical protein